MRLLSVLGSNLIKILKVIHQFDPTIANWLEFLGHQTI